MKKLIVFTIVSLLFAFSAQGAEVKIGYVDLNRALNECEQGKEAIRILEEMVREKEAILDKKLEEIKRLEEEIAKQASILTAESLKEKQDQREKLLRDYQRMVQDSQREVQKKRTEFMQKILGELRKIIRQYGEEKGYTAIFEKAESGILYVVKELDLTDEIIEKFNAATKASDMKR